MDSALAPSEIFSGAENIPKAFTDGLGPMQRWSRDQALPETVDVIVQRVAEGERLKVICRSRGWPYSLVAQWVASDEEMSRKYAGALMVAADDLAQETVEIADGADPETVGVAKLRVDARQKLSGKLYRDRYGEQVQHNVVVDSFSEMLRRVSERRLKALRVEQTAPERIVEGEVLTVPAAVATDEEV